MFDEELLKGLKETGLDKKYLSPGDQSTLLTGYGEPAPRPGIGEQFGNLFSRSFSKINFGEILGKSLWVGIIVMIGWVISKRQYVLLYINRIARQIIVKGKSLFEYFSEDGRRLIALSIILSSLLIGWMFRYEHVQGLLFRDRITGQIFKDQITNTD